MIALLDCVKADHGYNIDSKSVRNLLEILSSLSLHDRRTFLQFLTGSPKLPIGGTRGFKMLLMPRLQEAFASVHCSV